MTTLPKLSEGGDFTIGITKCRCGYPACSTYWLTGIGNFSQSSGFTREEAKEIVRRWNRHGELESAVRAIIAADAEYKRGVSPLEAMGIELHDPLETALQSARTLIEGSER